MLNLSYQSDQKLPTFAKHIYLHQSITVLGHPLAKIQTPSCRTLQYPLKRYPQSFYPPPLFTSWPSSPVMSTGKQYPSLALSMDTSVSYTHFVYTVCAWECLPIMEWVLWLKSLYLTNFRLQRVLRTVSAFLAVFGSMGVSLSTRTTTVISSANAMLA